MRIWKRLIKLELMTDMQYRLNFLFSFLGTSAWLTSELLFINFLFDKYQTIAGWERQFLILLVGFNQLWVGGLYFLIIWRSLTHIADQIRRGVADRIFTLPVNTRFFVSVFKIDWTSLSIMLNGIFLIIYVLWEYDFEVTFLNLLFSLVLLLLSGWIIYCLHFISMCTSFWIKNSASIMYFVNVLDRFTRYPYEIFTKGVWSFIFTFIIPIVIIANVPARAFLGILDFKYVLYSITVAVFLTIISQVLWILGIKRYESSGS